MLSVHYGIGMRLNDKIIRISSNVSKHKVVWKNPITNRRFNIIDVINDLLGKKRQKRIQLMK